MSAWPDPPTVDEHEAMRKLNVDFGFREANFYTPEEMLAAYRLGRREGVRVALDNVIELGGG